LAFKLKAPKINCIVTSSSGLSSFQKNPPSESNNTATAIITYLAQALRCASSFVNLTRCNDYTGLLVAYKVTPADGRKAVSEMVES